MTNDSYEITSPQFGTPREGFTMLMTPTQITEAIATLASELDSTNSRALLNSGRFDKFLSVLENLHVRLDYGLTPEEMIRAGKYGAAINSITPEHFSSNKRKSGELKLQVIPLNLDEEGDDPRISDRDQAIAKLGKKGLRPCELPELCALGATYPELQRKFPIVALGTKTPASDSNCFPFLCMEGGERVLRYWMFNPFCWAYDKCLFLAVDK